MAARSSPAGSEPGFRGPTVIKLVGITYRQLDYWARTGLVTPSVRAADGSGTQRLYGFTDVVELRIIKRLLDAGVSLRQIGRRRVGKECRSRWDWSSDVCSSDLVRAADGSGTQRLYGFTDVVELRIIKRLLDAGVSLR